MRMRHCIKWWPLLVFVAVAVPPTGAIFLQFFQHIKEVFYPSPEPTTPALPMPKMTAPTSGYCLEPNAGMDTQGMHGKYDNFKNHPCDRECQEGVHMVCYYHLFIHNSRTMGPECKRCLIDETACEAEHCIYADGLPSSVMVVNNAMPSPTIKVCYNDTVVAIIYNNLTEPTTQHWHGFHMATNPQSDGAPYVTQYPIMSGQQLKYRFVVDKPGTYWYHSHYSDQRARGVAGKIISYVPRSQNPHISLYDFDLAEHSLLLHDRRDDQSTTPSHNILINGMGRNQVGTLPDNDSRHRYPRFYFTYGKCYRIRVVSNGVSNCPMEVSVQGHSMRVIALDGNDIKPVKADKFHLHAGERVDFVLCAKQVIQAYWLTVKGLIDCANITQRAILQYYGTSQYQMPPSYELPKIDEVCVNSIWETKDVGTITGENLATVNLESLHRIPWPDTTKFFKLYLKIGVAVLNNVVSLQMNRIGYIHSPLSLLQACHLIDQEKAFCNATSLAQNGTDCVNNICTCTHVLHVPANTHVQIVVANLMGSTHPIHVHGYTYYLTAQGVLNGVEETSRIEELDRANDPRLKRLNTTLSNPVRKDVAQVPPNGFAKMEMYTDNPGVWLMHCHIEHHSILGMMGVLLVGDPCAELHAGKYDLW